jgi:hypothetical protein
MHLTLAMLGWVLAEKQRGGQAAVESAVTEVWLALAGYLGAAAAT